MRLNWRVKGVIQKVLSHAPGGVALNDFLQTSLGDLRDFDRNVAGKLRSDWIGLMEYLRQVGAQIHGKSLVEIGSGWYPTLPTAFYLAGVREIHTFDLVRHMHLEKTARMVQVLGAHLDLIASTAGISLQQVRERYSNIHPVTNLPIFLQKTNIYYHAPADATETGLPPASADLVFSNSVLEHVPRAVIARMMHENRRILRPDGFVVHCVACNDHYAHFDKSISFINFVRYSERGWAIWNNPLNYQNRLRAPDFLQMASDAGLRVVFQGRAIRPGTREALKTLPVAPEFRHYSEEDLVTTTIDFVAVPDSGASNRSAAG